MGYRLLNPGPISLWAFRGWVERGGQDVPNFQQVQGRGNRRRRGRFNRGNRGRVRNFYQHFH